MWGRPVFDLTLLFMIGVALISRPMRCMSFILKASLSFGLSLKRCLHSIILIFTILASNLFPWFGSGWYSLLNPFWNRGSWEFRSWIYILVEWVLFILEARFESFAIIIIVHGAHIIVACFVSEGRIRLKVWVEWVRRFTRAHFRFKQSETLSGCSYLIIHIILVWVLLMTVCWCTI